MPASEAYEHSEMILYRALVLEEGGQTEEALAYLDTSKVPLKRQHSQHRSHIVELVITDVGRWLCSSCMAAPDGAHHRLCTLKHSGQWSIWHVRY